jgi:hypothetical protein
MFYKSDYSDCNSTYFSDCNPNKSYRQYRCIENYLKQVVQHNHSCLIAHQLFRFTNGTNTRACHNLTEYQGAILLVSLCLHLISLNALLPTDVWKKTNALYETTMNEPSKFGCKVQCTTYRYTHAIYQFKKEELKVFHPLVYNDTNLFFKILTPRITVSNEFEVYDFNRLLGNIGGMAGLFLGFSFLDCFSTMVNKVYHWLGCL